MESLVKAREPAAFVALSLLFGNLVLILLAVLLDDGPVVDVAARLSYPAALPGLVVLLAMLVLSCVLGRTPHARMITGLSLAITAVAGVVAMGLAIADLAVGGPSLLIELLPAVAALSVWVVVLGLLILLLRRSSVSSGAEPAPEETTEPAPPEPAEVDPQEQPTWPTDQAAGAAWRTAGDAASGAPATGWVAPGAAEGWGRALEPAGSDSVAEDNPDPPASDGWAPRRP